MEPLARIADLKARTIYYHDSDCTELVKEFFPDKTIVAAKLLIGLKGKIWLVINDGSHVQIESLPTDRFIIQLATPFKTKRFMPVYVGDIMSNGKVSFVIGQGKSGTWEWGEFYPLSNFFRNLRVIGNVVENPELESVEVLDRMKERMGLSEGGKNHEKEK